MIVLKNPDTVDLEPGAKLALPEPEKRVHPALYSVSSRQYLDVDDVLARSLPACQALSASPLRKRIFQWPWRNRLTASQAIKQPVEPVSADD